MAHYQLTRDVSFDGSPHKKGKVVDGDKLPSGCVASCVRVGWLVEVEKPNPKQPAKKANTKAATSGE